MFAIAKERSRLSLKNERDDDLVENCDLDGDSNSETGQVVNLIDDQMEINVKDEFPWQHEVDFGHRHQIEPFEPFIKVESSDGNTDSNNAMIEICDSDDDDGQFEMQTTADANDCHMEIDLHPNDTHTGDLDSENDVKPFVKSEPDADSSNESELLNISFVVFDPNKENGRSAAATDDSCEAHQTSTSSNAHNIQSDRSVVKHNFKQHQRTHAQENSVTIKAHSNEIYRCTQCIRRFTDMRHLNLHMKTHKSNQYLYNCSRCMRKKFVRKADKDRHERRCKCSHYECHLCKVYVTRNKSHMENHMRTHSGVKPFHCVACGKSFQNRSGLRNHLNSVHSP